MVGPTQVECISIKARKKYYHSMKKEFAKRRTPLVYNIAYYQSAVMQLVTPRLVAMAVKIATAV